MELFSTTSLYYAFLRAYRGRGKTKEVIRYQLNLESNLICLHQKILKFEYEHSSYRLFIVNDYKKRAEDLSSSKE